MIIWLRFDAFHMWLNFVFCSVFLTQDKCHQLSSTVFRFITTQTMKTYHMSLWYFTWYAIILPFMLVVWQSTKWFSWPLWHVTSYDQLKTARNSEDQQTCVSWFWNYCSVCRQRMLRFTYLNCCTASGLTPRTLWLDRFFRASWFLFFLVFFITL